MITYSADLNELGNPVIWNGNFKDGSPVYEEDLTENKLIIAKNARNVRILITPSFTDINISATTSGNSGIFLALLGLGLTGVYNDTLKGILVTGNINIASSTLSDFPGSIQSMQFGFIENVTGSYQGIQVDFTINDTTFLVTPTKCSNCIDLYAIDAKEDYNNPLDGNGLAHRGVNDFQYKDNGSWVSFGIRPVESGVSSDHTWMGATDSYYSSHLLGCPCYDMVNTPLRLVRTVRLIPNCGGTSPVIFQNISDHFSTALTIQSSTASTVSNQKTYSTLKYTPSITYDPDTFNCCVSLDKDIEITPLTLLANNTAPHNCATPPRLEYSAKFQSRDLSPFVIGTLLTASEGGTTVTGQGTNFTSFKVGDSITAAGNLYIGEIASITSNTVLILTENSGYPISSSTSFTVATSATPSGGVVEGSVYDNPTTSSVFRISAIQNGTYDITAKYTNCCESVTKTWSVNVCGTYLVMTGDCNNPTIQNLSVTNDLKFTLESYDKGAIQQKAIYKDVLVAPESIYKLPKQGDGFYKLTVNMLDASGVVIVQPAPNQIPSQILFYDCEIKACQVSLYNKYLAFDHCVECVDKKPKEKEYRELGNKITTFNIHRNILYSYWNQLKAQQSIPESWDIEDHLQELASYSDTMVLLKGMCADCGITFSSASSVLGTNCGCNK